MLKTLIKCVKKKENNKKKAKQNTKKQIYREIQKRKQNKINNELKKLKLHKLANIDNISERGLVNIRKCNAYFFKTLHQIAKLRNINSNISKKDIRINSF